MAPVLHVRYLSTGRILYENIQPWSGHTCTSGCVLVVRAATNLVVLKLLPRVETRVESCWRVEVTIVLNGNIKRRIFPFTDEKISLKVSQRKLSIMFANEGKVLQMWSQEEGNAVWQNFHV